MATEFRSRVRAVVRAIPRGKVLTYGAVAALAGRPRAARAVGAALAAESGDDPLPWWRVISASGRITSPKVHHVNRLQRQLLTDEGTGVSEGGRVDLDRHAWRPEPGRFVP